MKITYDPTKEKPARKGIRQINGTVISNGVNVVPDEFRSIPLVVRLMGLGAITVVDVPKPPTKKATRKSRKPKEEPTILTEVGTISDSLESAPDEEVDS